MPDSVATLGTLMLTVGLLAAGALAWLSSLLARWVGGMADGTVVGIPLALVVWGAGMLWVVKDMAVFAWETRQMVAVDGVLLGFDAVKLRESRSGRRLTGRGPVVAFTLPDGREHELVGLSGSQASLQPGDTVPVRVDPAHPERAIVDDFQNRLAALWLFGTLALLALGLALLSVVDSLTAPRTDREPVGRGRAARRRARAEGLLPPHPGVQPPPPSRFQRWRAGVDGQRWRRQLRRGAWSTAVLAVLAVFALGAVRDVGPSIAIGLAGLASALGVKTLGDACDPEARLAVTLLGGGLGVFGLGMFAALVWQLTAA